MITCDDNGTVSVSGNEADIMAQFMVICEDIRANIVSKHFDNTFQVNSEMQRIIKEVNKSGRKRSGL
jgi:hypothetical protein